MCYWEVVDVTESCPGRGDDVMFRAGLQSEYWYEYMYSLSVFVLQTYTNMTVLCVCVDVEVWLDTDPCPIITLCSVLGEGFN